MNRNVRVPVREGLHVRLYLINKKDKRKQSRRADRQTDTDQEGKKGNV